MEYFTSKEYKSVHYTARHDTLHTVHTDEISSLTPRHRQMFVCLLLTEYKQLTACTWKGYHIVLISQHCNDMLINFMYYRILIFQSLQWGGCITWLVCWECITLNWENSWGWHRSAKTRRRLIFVINCILLSALVDWCINYTNTHSLHNIQKKML